MYKKLHSKILLLLAMMLVGASSVKAEMVLSVNNATIGYKSQSGTLDVTAKDFFLKDYKNGYFEWFENAEGQSCNSSYYEDWITLELSDDKSKISFEVKTENPLSVSRTAYFKLVLWNTVNDIIYSDMVSITQEGHRVVSLSPHEVTLPSHEKDVEGTVSVSANFDLVNTH